MSGPGANGALRFEPRASYRPCFPTAATIATRRFSATLSTSNVGVINMPKIYIARMPLIGLEALDLLPGVALHAAVIIEEVDHERSTWLFDFLPQDATLPSTIAQLLAGMSVPAKARVKQLTRVPQRRCRLVGHALRPDAVAQATSFQASWSKELVVFKQDCRHHVRSLVFELAGVQVPL